MVPGESSTRARELGPRPLVKGVLLKRRSTAAQREVNVRIGEEETTIIVVPESEPSYIPVPVEEPVSVPEREPERVPA